MPLPFTKMHGAGNDYVYVNAFAHRVADAPALAQVISDRHTGVGSDGLILIAPPEPVEGAEPADVRMIMYNADGSRAEMCGNGIRCVAKYAYDHGVARRNPLRAQTDSGVLTLELEVEADRVARVRVDMGPPRLTPAEIPVELPGESVVDAPIEVAGRQFLMTCVSMGNPHATVYVDDLRDFPLHMLGPKFETHPLFLNKINAHFVRVISPGEVEVLHWERGSGPTLACGTGACAVCVAGVLAGKTDRKLRAELPGGALELEWDERSGHVFMTGPAVEVFTGEWPTE